jgi:hypothetical protein
MSGFERLLCTYLESRAFDPPCISGGHREALIDYVAAIEADLSRAIELLHMLDNHAARHPDVAAFLDEYEVRHE